jgi:hypothetical protein
MIHDYDLSLLDDAIDAACEARRLENDAPPFLARSPVSGSIPVRKGYQNRQPTFSVALASHWPKLTPGTVDHTFR